MQLNWQCDRTDMLTILYITRFIPINCIKNEINIEYIYIYIYIHPNKQIRITVVQNKQHISLT